MIKRLLLSTVIYLMGTLMPVGAQTGKQGNNTGAKDGVKFLEDISITVAPSTTQVSNPKDVFIDVEVSSKKVFLSSVEAPIENASNLQFKYAILLDQ